MEDNDGVLPEDYEEAVYNEEEDGEAPKLEEML